MSRRPNFCGNETNFVVDFSLQGLNQLARQRVWTRIAAETKTRSFRLGGRFETMGPLAGPGRIASSAAGARSGHGRGEGLTAGKTTPMNPESHTFTERLRELADAVCERLIALANKRTRARLQDGVAPMSPEPVAPAIRPPCHRSTPFHPRVTPGPWTRDRCSTTRPVVERELVALPDRLRAARGLRR